MASVPAAQTNGISIPGISMTSDPTASGITVNGASTTNPPDDALADGNPGGDGNNTTKPASAPRPRDSRVIELLLTSQGVTSYESRVPLVLMDFAYRHTSAVLSDAIHLSNDPISTGKQASSAAAGADPVVSAAAIKLAIAARLGYQFRGGGAGGGLSKEWLQELARERNKVALPKVSQNDWAVRLPSERFVLSGLGWGLADRWEEDGESSSGDEDEDDEMEDAMDMLGKTKEEDVGGDGVEGGTLEDVFGQDVDMDMDEDMETA
ncbi:Transcription initiation factor TFIID subunit 9 [Ceratocystis pirilliformis]|uniref:Transcription initiation factor TFIID subunit 9 n=1 Tax=Ceratocystis pirilliformis TaxID=259994 RepID=A0ABR3Z9G4_9PEZI